MKFYSHPYPEESIRHINCISLPSVEAINLNSFFDVAQMYKEAGKALIGAETPELKRAESYFPVAENFYKHLEERQLDGEYVGTQRAENLILLNQFSEAATLLEKHPAPGSPFWNYRIGQALAHGSEKELHRSIKHLQTAIDMEIQKTESKYLSAFYHELAKSLNKLQPPSLKMLTAKRWHIAQMTSIENKSSKISRSVSKRVFCKRAHNPSKYIVFGM